MRFVDLTGEMFGRWCVLRVAERKRGRIFWRCVCKCGREKDVAGILLTSGKSKSCGCYRVDAGRKHGKRINLQHGHARNGKEPATYAAWAAMKSRCHNPNHSNYRRYGARGIVVCERWRESYEAFLADVGPRPSPRHSLDRIDNDGNYEPGNVRWATPKEQNRNTRSNRLVTIRGETRTLAEWLELAGRSRKTFYVRIEQGWSEEDSLFTAPLKKNGEPR